MIPITENIYTGDGSTKEFGVTFEYQRSSDINCSLNGVVTEEFTLKNELTVRFNTAPEQGVVIRIYRRTSTENLPHVFSPGSSIKAKDLNQNFDQILYVAQEDQRDANYAYEAVDLASRALNKAEESLEVAEGAEDLAEDAIEIAEEAMAKAEEAVETSNSDYTFPGGVQRTIANRLQDSVSVKDFGAKGDGSTDDTAAVLSAIRWVTGQNRSYNKTNRALKFPAGRYLINNINHEYDGLGVVASIYGEGDSSVIECKDPNGGIALRPKQARSTINVSNLLFSPWTAPLAPGESRYIDYALWIGYNNAELTGYTTNNNKPDNISDDGKWTGWNNPSVQGGGGVDRNAVNLQNITVDTWDPNMAKPRISFTSGIIVMNANRPYIENVTIFIQRKYYPVENLKTTDMTSICQKYFGADRPPANSFLLSKNDLIQTEADPSWNFTTFATLDKGDRIVWSGSRWMKEKIPPDALDYRPSDRPQNKVTFGLDLDGCYKPIVSNCYCNGQVMMGLSVFKGTDEDDDNLRNEGFLLENSTFNGPFYGVSVRMPPKNLDDPSNIPFNIGRVGRHPEVTIKDCHMNNRGPSVLAIGLKYLHIHGNLSYCGTSFGERYNNNGIQALDFDLTCCSNVTITDNKYGSGTTVELFRHHVYTRASNNLLIEDAMLDAPVTSDSIPYIFKKDSKFDPNKNITVNIRLKPSDSTYPSASNLVKFGDDIAECLYTYRNTIETIRTA